MKSFFLYNVPTFHDKLETRLIMQQKQLLSYYWSRCIRSIPIILRKIKIFVFSKVNWKIPEKLFCLWTWNIFLCALILFFCSRTYDLLLSFYEYSNTVEIYFKMRITFCSSIRDAENPIRKELHMNT